MMWLMIWLVIGLTIGKHALAVINIVGSSLDVLGALYLAYDLLGGEHGPLRTLTRSVTYGSIFGIGFGLTLGPLFGLATGVTHGLTLGFELSRTARQRPSPGIWYDTVMSAIRGFGYAVGTIALFGLRFGIAFGILSTVGQAIAYQAGVRPSLDYAPGTRPAMSKRQFLAAVNRTVFYAIGGYISALAAGDQRTQALRLGLEAGLVIGVITAIVNLCMPLVEWAAERLPPKRMGVVGVGCILIGFALQSVQYWVALLDVTVQ